MHPSELTPRTGKDAMCRNEHNLTGLCNRNSCPLANSQYATVELDEGKIYLVQRTAERSHSPRDMWQRTLLPADPQEAAQLIQTKLQYWPEFQRTMSLKRYVRMREVLLRMRKLRHQFKTRIVPVRAKEERRLKSREERALRAARLETAIEQELLSRLHAGIYGDVYNIHPGAFNKFLDEESQHTGQQLAESESDQEIEVEHEYEFVAEDSQE